MASSVGWRRAGDETVMRSVRSPDVVAWGTAAATGEAMGGGDGGRQGERSPPVSLGHANAGLRSVGKWRLLAGTSQYFAGPSSHSRVRSEPTGSPSPQPANTQARHYQPGGLPVPTDSIHLEMVMLMHPDWPCHTSPRCGRFAPLPAVIAALLEHSFVRLSFLQSGIQ